MPPLIYWRTNSYKSFRIWKRANSTLPLLAGENISHKFIAPTVASAIDLIVHTTLDAKGVRRVNEVAAVTGRYENDRAEIESLWKWDGTCKCGIRGSCTWLC